jgi:hypothetical protein
LLERGSSRWKLLFSRTFFFAATAADYKNLLLADLNTKQAPEGASTLIKRPDKSATLFSVRGRAARFFSIQHTKTGEKIYQMTIKSTEYIAVK